MASGGLLQLRAIFFGPHRKQPDVGRHEFDTLETAWLGGLYWMVRH